MSGIPSPVTTQPRPILGVAEKIVPIVLTVGFAAVAIWQWPNVPGPMQVIFVIAVVGALGQSAHAFSTVKIGTDTITLQYPGLSFTYAPDRIISIEFPSIPPVYRIRPQGRRYLAFVIHPRSLSNRDQVAVALRDFAARHRIPGRPS